MKNSKGFTLIEVLVVVSIIGILYALALPTIFPKNPWRGALRSFLDTAKLARAKAMSTGHSYRLYPAKTIQSAGSKLASGSANFVVEEGIEGATCTLKSNSSGYSGSGIAIATNIGRWVSASQFNLDLPKNFEFAYWSLLEFTNSTGVNHINPICFNSNGYVGNALNIYGSSGGNFFIIRNLDPAIVGAFAIIVFSGYELKPTVALFDSSGNRFPVDADGLPLL